MNAPLSQPIQQAFSTPIKIFDGLFMADQHIAQVLQKLNTGSLVLLNKFSYACYQLCWTRSPQ